MGRKIISIVFALYGLDKATLPWESTEDGYIAKHLIPEGSTDLDVGTPVGLCLVIYSEPIPPFFFMFFFLIPLPFLS